MREICHLGSNEEDLPTGQCVLGTIGFHLSTAPCGGVKSKYPAALQPLLNPPLWREHNFGVAGQTV